MSQPGALDWVAGIATQGERKRRGTPPDGAEGEFRSRPGGCARIGVSAVRCSGEVDCRHQDFYTISSSYDRETKVLTFFLRCDKCGLRLTEVAQRTYESRFVATRVERWTPNRIIEPPPRLRRMRESGTRGRRTPTTGTTFTRRACDYGNGIGIGSSVVHDETEHRDRPEGGRVRHRLTLTFDEFGWETLESEARRNGESLDDLLSRAAAYFNAYRSTRRAAMPIPGFEHGARGTPCQIRLEVSRDCWESLESEARRQGLPLRRLLEHAALLYLADLDSGRVANRLLGRAAGGDGPHRAE